MLLLADRADRIRLTAVLPSDGRDGGAPAQARSRSGAASWSPAAIADATRTITDVQALADLRGPRRPLGSVAPTANDWACSVRRGRTRELLPDVRGPVPWLCPLDDCTCALRGVAWPEGAAHPLRRLAGPLCGSFVNIG